MNPTRRRSYLRDNDPNFLLCVALTYLGLPPGVWRIIVNAFLKAVSLEYHHRYGKQRGSSEFQEFRKVFLSWSAFNIFRTVVVFLAESKIGVIPISNHAAKAIRTRLLAQLAARGVQMSAIVGASQIVRKVNIYLEIAWITGCVTFCSSIAMAKVVTEFTVTAAKAIADFVDVVQTVATAISTGIIVRPILVGKAMMDPSNWDTDAVGSASVALRLVGNSIWARLRPNNPDKFLSNLSKPLSRFSLPRNVIEEIATSMTRTVNARGGLYKSLTFTADFILGLTPLAFVQTLKDYKLLNFRRPPEKIAAKVIGY